MPVTIHDIRKQFHRKGDWVNKFHSEYNKNMFFHHEGDRGANDVSQIICDGWQVTWHTQYTDDDGLDIYQKFGQFFLTEYDADGVMAQLLMGVIPDAGDDS